MLTVAPTLDDEYAHLAMREAAYSLTASKLDAAAKRWRRLVVHSLVSEDAAV
jgi:hypothetical protein